MTTPAYDLPLPRPTAVSKPFWDAAREHRLVVQRSSRTGKTILYPRIVSPFAADDALEWVDASGKGRVVAATVVRTSTDPAWAQRTPYVVAIVELEEGARLTTNIVDCDPDTVRPGMAVAVRFDDVTPEVTLVKFAPADQP